MSGHTVADETPAIGAPSAPNTTAGIDVREYRMLHPFKWEEVGRFDADVPYAAMSWVPGWRYVDSGPEDVEMAWDGLGEQIRRVVSIHKPGPTYPARVFYVRQWRPPGNAPVFGRTALRITTTQAFRRWATGQSWRDFQDRRCPFFAPLDLYLHCQSAPTLAALLVRSAATIADASPASGMNHD